MSTATRSGGCRGFLFPFGDLDAPARMTTTSPAWGYDFLVAPRGTGPGACCSPLANDQARPTGGGSWTGTSHTHLWVDPHTRLAGSLYPEGLPVAAPEVLRMCSDVERVLWAS